VRGSRGQAMIVIAFCLIGILALMALVMDTGRVFIEHAELQRAVDAASLAAAQDLPASEDQLERARTKGMEAAIKNGAPSTSTSISFLPSRTGDTFNIVLTTSQRVVPMRLSQILGFQSWTISAVAAARSGPISIAQHWVPLGVWEGEVEMHERIRLGNTPHTPANSLDVKRLYAPLNHGNLRVGVRDAISTRLHVGATIPLLRTYNPLDICDGINDRIRNRLNVVGCFRVHEPINLAGLNIVGPGTRRDWAYGSDPRLIFIPFIRPIPGDPNNVQVAGFGLFYIEYAHFNPAPHGGAMPLTEISGFFVRTVMEGPIEEDAIDYGVIGIEYVDLERLP